MLPPAAEGPLCVCDWEHPSFGCDKEPSKLTSIRIRVVRVAKQPSLAGQRSVVLMALFWADRDDRGSLRGSLWAAIGVNARHNRQQPLSAQSLSRFVA